MRITYLAKVINKEGSGVNKKIAAQIKRWRREGENVTPIFIGKSDELSSDFKGLNCIVVKDESWASNYLKNKALENILSSSMPDVVYFRMSNLPFFTVSKIFKFPVVVEINTRVFEELKISYSGVKYFLLKGHFKKILKRAAGFIGVTKECLYGLPNKPSAQIGNSVDFNKDLYKDAVKKRAPANVCVFVGSAGCAWHGVDRLIDIARANSEYEFWVIGYTTIEIESNICSLLPANVKAFGHVTGKRYDALLRKACVAFGSLAMDRNSMEFSSSLKNRDYLQYGLPIIIQGADSDISRLDMVYSLPANFSVDDASIALKRFHEISGIEIINSIKAVNEAISSEKIEVERLKFIRQISF